MWKALYASDIPHEQTVRECDFIARFVPIGTHCRILDLACGAGRFSVELAARGYTVTGADLDRMALRVASDTARSLGVAATFIEADLRSLDVIDERYDGVVLLWQSYGFFDGVAQVRLFAQLRRLLRPGGRLILDLYNRLYYTRGSASSGQFEYDLGLPTAAMRRERIHLPFMRHREDLASLAAPLAGLVDPHLFTPGEIAGIAANHDLALLLACSECSADVPATAEHPRMQLVFERVH
ncbi:MAG: Methyltransferase [Chlorobi bacterium]|nr:Methyltransferase [Chlorobiota bacterium]